MADRDRETTSFTGRLVMRYGMTLMGLTMLLGGGCNAMLNSWLDPTQVGRFRGSVVTMELRRSVSVADEPDTDLHAAEPTAEDVEVIAKDYVLRPGDVVDLSIYELMIPGQMWVEPRQVTREGQIRIPQVTVDVEASGKTAGELEDHIAGVLESEGVLIDAVITVIVSQPRHMSYNILGSIRTPGSNMLPRPDFRLLDALATAGGIGAGGGLRHPSVRTVYVFRAPSGKGEDSDESGTADQAIAPAMFTSIGQPNGDGQAGHWVWVNGEWKFVAAPDPTATDTAASQPVQEDQEDVGIEKWEDLAAETPVQRVLAIPIRKLEQADPRYNVVIRDGDTIWVPSGLQGEFYVMGNVGAPGVYSLTGREVTIRQAISAARGLGPLADPSRCELIRRIGDRQEQIVYVNIDRIFAGLDEDIILKPNDIVNVGTNPLMQFLAVLRNAFRATYGFGFVYDRNFADIDSYGNKANPSDRRRAEQQARGIGF